MKGLHRGTCGEYRVAGRLGRGGEEGAVFLAIHARLFGNRACSGRDLRYKGLLP